MVAFEFGRVLVPAQRRVVVVCAREHDLVGNLVVGEVRVRFVVAESELEDGHPRITQLVTQRTDRRGDQAQVLHDNREPAKRTLQRIEQSTPRPGNPMPEYRGLRFCRYLPG